MLSQAPYWLSDCEQQHPSCREHEDHKYQPPRLLQLHQSSIRLVETQKSATSHRYVALSYCWGRRPQHLTLIAGNIETLRKGLSIDELAKTFRHAIEVARSLGFHYLWVDVLYIIQDGDNYIEDWERHLAEMADIYVNCKVKIAADHGEDADAGLFRRRLPDEIMPCIFEGAAFPKNNGEESAQQDEPQLRTVYDIVDPYSDDNLVRRSPLMRRAWVHQERLLSRRVLHFGDQQLTWECTKFVACETYPAGLPSYLDIGVPFSWYNGKSEQWYHVIGRYSAAFLSRQKDRLPAITGISKRICDGGSARYAAGMIIVDLPESLLWQYDGGLYGGVVRPYRAPSWSWASREGAVLFCHAKMTGARQDFAQVDSVHLVYADPYNQFGELKEDILRLTGPLISISETGSQQRAFTIDLQLYPSHSVDNLSLPSYSGLFFAESPLL